MVNSRTYSPNAAGNVRFWVPLEGYRYWSETITVKEFDLATLTAGSLVNFEGWSRIILSVATRQGGTEIVHQEFSASDGATSDAVVGLGQLKVELTATQTGVLQATGYSGFFMSVGGYNPQGQYVDLQGGNVSLDRRPVEA